MKTPLLLTTPKRNRNRERRGRSSPTDSGGSTSRRPHIVLGDVVWFVVSFGMVAIILMSIVGPTRQIVEEELVRSGDTWLLGIKKRDAVWANMHKKEFLDEMVEAVDDLDHEGVFLAAIRSCRPDSENTSSRCQAITPLKRGQKRIIQRIALITPPGRYSRALSKSLELVVSYCNERQRGRTISHGKQRIDSTMMMEVVQTTHAPAYGNWSAHGYSKIIRLVPHPLLLEVTEALRGVLHNEDNSSDLTLNDFKGALRQVLRFHCHTSHVAQHTPVLSVNADDLVLDPRASIRTIYEFLDPAHSISQEELDELLQGMNNTTSIEDVEEVLKSYPTREDEDPWRVNNDLEEWALVHFNKLERQANVSVHKVLDEVLSRELRMTQNMTAWPCLSFWAAGDDTNPTDMSVFTLRLAQELSPLCIGSDQYTHCVEDYDICEAMGDPICS